MVTVNAGGLAEGVFESELFGHVKGAFTDAKADRVGRFELADGGTLFLDEIANVPHEPAGQAAARARDGRDGARRLLADAARGRAHDLGHQRQSGGRSSRRALPAGLAVPAEHHRDPPAAAARAPRGHPAAGRAFPGACTRSATASASRASIMRRCRRCSTHPWPGNVRELDHVVERAVLMAQDSADQAGRPGAARRREGTPRSKT